MFHYKHKIMVIGVSHCDQHCSDHNVSLQTLNYGHLNGDQQCNDHHDQCFMKTTSDGDHNVLSWSTTVMVIIVNVAIERIFARWSSLFRGFTAMFQLLNCFWPTCIIRINCLILSPTCLELCLSASEWNSLAERARTMWMYSYNSVSEPTNQVAQHNSCHMIRTVSPSPVESKTSVYQQHAIKATTVQP